MKVKSLALITIMALATLGFADGVATDIYKGTKATGRTTGKVVETTANGTARITKGTGKVAKVTAHGTERAAVDTGHGVKKVTVKTVDVLK
jgi:hypothetical protein